MTARGLFGADYAAFCADKGRDPARGGRALKLLRVLTNPSLQAVLLLRLANAAPRPLQLVFRQILITKHASDWTGPSEIGPGLVLPHPLMLVIGPGVTLGRDVTLSHDVSIGADARGRGPRIGDGVRVYPGTLIVGDVTIGDGAIIGAHCVVTRDVPAGHMLKRDGTVERLRDSGFVSAHDGAGRRGPALR